MAKKKATKKKAKKKTVKKKQIKKTPPSDICFVIMPFGGWLDVYYESVFKPAISKAGLLPRRADDIYKPSIIVEDIWNLTLDSKVLLADLTGKNPNVLYELGLAHACCKPVVIVTESIEDVPFDLRSLRVITYNKNEPKWGLILQNAIMDSLIEVLEDTSASVPSSFLARHPAFPAKLRESASKTELDRLEKENARLRRQVKSRPSPSHSRSALEREIEKHMMMGGWSFEQTMEEFVAQGFSPSQIRKIIDRLRYRIE